MKIVYDEAKAITEKQKIDTETPVINSQAEKRNAIMIIGMLLASLAAIFGLVCAHNHIMELLSREGILWDALFALYVISYIMLPCIALAIYLVNREEIMPAKEHYSASINYHLATQNKSILKSTITKNSSDPFFGDYYTIVLTLEDINHVVTTSEIQLHSFKTGIRTDIHEIIVNLDGKTVSIPYAE